MPVGSLGRAVSRFSGRIRACRAGSRWRASSSMVVMKLLERSIFFSFAKGCEGDQRDTGHTIFSCPAGATLPCSSSLKLGNASQFSTCTRSIPEEIMLKSRTPWKSPQILQHFSLELCSVCWLSPLDRFGRHLLRARPNRPRNQPLDPSQPHPPPLRPGRLW